MEGQIENAIEIAWNPSSDAALQAQAFDFLNSLRSDPRGWHVCARLFTRSPKASEVVRLVSLEVVNNAVHTGALDRQSLISLKEIFLGYIRTTYGGETAPPDADLPSLQNKLTQTLTYLFVFLYQEGWETFIEDFWMLTSLSNTPRRDNVRGVLLYLRTLGSVHDEIADQLLSRSGDEMKRNTDLKNLLRERDVERIARSWQDLLSQYRNQEDVILEMTLKVLGKWVSWIDISLVVNQDMLNLLFPLIGRTNPSAAEDKVRNAAIDTFAEIVGKKMKPTDKIDMINFLNLGEIIAQIVATPTLKEFKGTPKYDTDLAEATAKLVNTVMVDIMRVLEDQGVDGTTRANAEQQLQQFVPFLLGFFSDEYDEVCSTVIPALTDILTFLRKVDNLPPSYSEMLPAILNAIIMKMRYDETCSWGNEEEQSDEAEFQELRKRLHILQKSVAAVNQALYMEVLRNLVATTFSTLDQQGAQMNWRDLDLALHEMYLFGELALPNSGLTAKNQPNTKASETLAAMMQKMVESGIANFPHPAILLQYMEICVRYCSFFEAQPAFIPQVLESFVRLVHHDHVRLWTRSWYLFHRWVKQLRGQVGHVAETVIQSISDLLPIKAELPGEDADDDMASDESDHSANAVFKSQLFLFEAVGCISSTANTPNDKQALYARLVTDPLYADLEQHLPRAKAGDAQAIIQVHHVIMALGALAGGFSFSPPVPNSHTRPPPDRLVSDEFSRSAEAILIALRELNGYAEIRNACRSSFSRLLGVLGSAVLPQLPHWIEGLLSQSSSKDEMAMFLRLLEQVVYGFKGEIYDVLDLLLTPLLQRVFSGLREPVTGTDDGIQLAELRREYLSFIQIILNNNLAGVLVSVNNQQFFEELVSTIIGLARTLSGNLATSRLAFTVLAKMASVWGGEDVANIAAEPSAPLKAPTPVIPGFDRFMIEHFHIVCWEVLRDPDFRPSADAQSKQVLNEIASLEQTIYLKTGDIFIQHLQTITFPTLGINGPEFLRSMTTSTDRKAFPNYLANLLRRRG